MFKRYYAPVFISAILSLLVTNLAFAKSNEDPRRPRGGGRGIGQIIALGVDQITVNSRLGEEHVIFVDENTRYREIEGETIGFEDLQVGDWIAGIVRFDADLGGPLARLILLLPEDYDPSQRLGFRRRGKVLEVDTEAKILTLQTRAGSELTVIINENTLFKGGVDDLSDLQEGMVAAVAGIKQADGGLLAHVVLARHPLVKLAGEIKSIDLGGSSFILDTRRGEEVSILVDEQTKFRSREGEINGLEDLQPGVVAVVLAKKEEGGILVALGVAAGTWDQLPHLDLRVAGRVLQVGEDSFSIKVRDGEQYTLIVTDETRFRSRGGVVQGLEEMRPGMPVAIGAVQLEYGSYEAKLVLVGMLRRP